MVWRWIAAPGFAALIGFFAAVPSGAESLPGGSTPADSAEASGGDAHGPDWSLSLSVNMIPDITYLTPTVAMSWGRHYAEARYQYEDLATTSLWYGRSFGGGEAFTWWIAPIGGVAFGRTNGVAPGVVVELEWRQFTFSSSAEHLFDLDDEDASFFYDWTEWIVHVHPAFSPGITIERSRPRDTGLTLNTGLTLYSSVREVMLSFYGFNVWDSEDDYYVLGVSRDF